jgi:hypothetical protein
MALVLIEEVLMGLEEVKDALEKAVMTLEMLVEDLHPGLGNDLQTVLTKEFLHPLQARTTAMERLLDDVATTADH